MRISGAGSFRRAAMTFSVLHASNKPVAAFMMPITLLIATLTQSRRRQSRAAAMAFRASSETGPSEGSRAIGRGVSQALAFETGAPAIVTSPAFGRATATHWSKAVDMHNVRGLPTIFIHPSSG